jgi:hypothetical protein
MDSTFITDCDHSNKAKYASLHATAERGMQIAERQSEVRNSPTEMNDSSVIVRSSRGQTIDTVARRLVGSSVPLQVS